MNIEKRIIDNIHIYKLIGRMDLYPFEVIHKNIFNDAVHSESKSVILDFSGLEYISSLGIKYIYDLKQELQKKGIQLVIAGVSESIIQVLQLLGLYETFSTFSTIKEAIEYIDSLH